jgi:nicotinamidase-related amidase
MTNALLVIDVQRSLLDEGPWNREGLMGNIRRLIERARDSDAAVIFLQHTGVEPDGSIDDSLGRTADDLVIRKDFCDSFLGTRLHEELQDRGIDKLFVCGMQTDYCIDTTCRKAASLGYEVILVNDAHSTFDHDSLAAEKIVSHHNRILRNLPAGTGSVRTMATAEVGFA